MRKAKRRCQQLVAAAMCVGMLAGMVPTQVFAEEAQPAAAIAQQEQAPAPSANETETPAPTEEPAAEQTPAPTEEPSAEQTPAPTEEPAAEQTPAPTEEPAAKQTPAPAEEPAAEQTPAPAEEPAAEETAAQAAEVMSAAVQDSENENFGKVLEDQDLVAVRSGASLVESLSTGKQVKVTAEWISGSNSAVDGGGALQEGDAFFKRSRFTLYANVKFDAAHDNTSALLVGSDAGANFRIVPCKTDGTAVLKVNNGTEHKLSKAMTAGEWNALALVYAENDTEGTVAVYLNGEEVLPATGIGFKLSEKSGIVGAVGATFGTGFMRTGLYDELVVTGAADAEAAKVETAARKAAADAVVAVDGVVTVTGAEVEQAAQNVNGWTYKGLGMLNGNSTSNLLLDYKAESPDAYWAMMRYLFGGDYPLFSNIKMEMGNDGNNSTGAEACTMRYEDEEADASRSPGFVMAADAKTINPNVKVSILRWGCPNWVNAYKGTDWYAANYKWYKETIFDAYEKYGYVVDYINPDTNETGNPDSGIIKYFANAIANETDFPEYFTEEAKQAYRSIKIVASDENKGLKIVPMMRGDKDLYDAVDAIGFHYRTNATDDYIKMADVDDKEVWYSEGCATFGYSELQENKTAEYGAGTIGGYQSPLALLDSFPNAFVGSRRTMYMFQPAIGAFYEGIQYGHKELLSARDPWSGYIHYDPVLYMLGHITKFAKTGWENASNTAGIWRVLPGATFASFGASSNEHATAGIDGNASYMTLAAPDKQNFSTVFVNNTRNEKTFAVKLSDMALKAEALHIWTTATDSYMQKGEDAKIEGGIAYVTVPAYSVVTATTLDTEPERFPTEDGSGDYIQTATRAVLDTDATGKKADTADDYLYADNFDYKEEELNYIVDRGNEPRYMLDTHGAWIVENGRLKQENAAGVTQWNGGDPATIVGDWRWMDYSASVDMELPNADANRYERLTIRAQTGMNWNNSGYTLELNGAGSWKLFRIGSAVASGSVAKDDAGKYNVKLIGLGDTVYAYINGTLVTSYTDANPMLSGRVKISSNWTQVYADNLEIRTVKGGIPYATAMIDGQDDGVVYEGAWAINNPGGGSADNWYRTMSEASTAGAAFTFAVDGSGFAIMGSNNGSAVIDVYVDGVMKVENAATKAAHTRGEAYILSDLAAGKHTVKVVLKSGTLKVDALNTIGNRLPAAEGAVTEVLTKLPALESYVTGSGIGSLPAAVEVKKTDGTTATLPVDWNVDMNALNANAYGAAEIQGTVKGAVNPLGEKLTVSVKIGEVIPGDTVVFIDSVAGDPAAVSGGTTESYTLYKKALGSKLLNEAFDQRKTADNDWGLVDTDAGTKGYSSTADKTATGIYGRENKAGETLTYALTLPAGSYILTSAHHEWWGQNRPMTAVVTDAEGNALSETATLNLNGSSGDILNKAVFKLDGQKTVYYTVTATGSQAPVISWLGVQRQPAETKVVVTKGLTSVPEALQNTAFTTTEKIEKELVKQLSDEISGCKVSIYDVKLMLDFGDGSLIEAEENSFPAGGMDVWFDLPDGVTAENFSQFDIEVAHMLCTRDHAGEVELLKDPELDAANGKLKVHVGSFSPFAIGWKAKPASGPVVTPGTGSTGTTPGGSTGSNTGSNTNAGNSSNTAAGNAGGTAAAASGTAKPAGAADNKAAVPAKSGLIPQTSDSFPPLPVAGIALVSLAAVGLLALLKKKKHETR